MGVIEKTRKKTDLLDDSGLARALVSLLLSLNCLGEILIGVPLDLGSLGSVVNCEPKEQLRIPHNRNFESNERTNQSLPGIQPPPEDGKKHDLVNEILRKGAEQGDRADLVEVGLLQLGVGEEFVLGEDEGQLEAGSAVFEVRKLDVGQRLEGLYNPKYHA